MLAFLADRTPEPPQDPPRKRPARRSRTAKPDFGWTVAIASVLLVSFLYAVLLGLQSLGKP